MTVELAVIGAGQLGSRHLQSLARLERPARIWVWDPHPSALERARERWAEAKPGSHLAVDFTSRLPEKLDAAVVATDAASREKAVQTLLKGRKVRFLILEKLLAQDPEGLDRLGSLVERAGAKAWVNCPRRIWPVYRDRKPALPVELRVSGTGWGLATNAIHFLDLASFLSGCRDFSIDTEGLCREEIPSKRPGFVEFFGTLSAHGTGGHRVVLSCEPGEEKHKVELNGETIDESTAPFQSQLTAGVVEDLLSRGDCALTPFKDSVRVHRPYLEALREHWRQVKDKQAAFCPIT